MLTAYATSCITAFLSRRHNEQMNRHNGEIKKKTYKKEDRVRGKKERRELRKKTDREGQDRKKEERKEERN